MDPDRGEAGNPGPIPRAAEGGIQPGGIPEAVEHRPEQGTPDGSACKFLCTEFIINHIAD